MSAGKGDRPRNCLSQEFKNNYEQINWGKKKNPKQKNKPR
jgi:hypothetical protein